MPTHLLSLLPCCVHLSLHTGYLAPILCSARALKTRYQFGRSGKHNVGHVGGALTQVSSGICGSAVTIVLAALYRRFGPAIIHLRSAGSGVSSLLSLFLRFGADLRGMQTFPHARLWFDYGASREGRRTLMQRISPRSACFVRL